MSTAQSHPGRQPSRRIGIVVSLQSGGVTICDHDDCDGLLERIERDQFAYYLTLAYMDIDPDDWPAFRRALHGAVLAALYLDRELRHGGSINGASHQLGVMRLLDDIRSHYNPAVNWAGFVLELWERRQEVPTAPPS